MQFAKMGATQTRQKTVRALNGGMNTQMPPEYIDDTQLADCCNVYWADGALRTRPAFSGYGRAEEDGEILAVHETADGEYAFLLTLKTLWVFCEGRLITRKEMTKTDPGAHAFFADGGHGNVLLFWRGVWQSEMDGAAPKCRIYSITVEGQDVLVENVIPYVPTVVTNGVPVKQLSSANVRSAGTMYEGFNMLTPDFRLTWTTDGDGVYYRPPFQMGAGRYTVKYTHTDGQVYSFRIDAVEDQPFVCYPRNREECPTLTYYEVNENGDFVLEEDGQTPKTKTVTIQLRISLVGNYIAFADVDHSLPIALPFVGFSNNVEVVGNRAGAFGEDEIHLMSIANWFGGDRSGVAGGTRLFVSGNAAAPNLVRYSDVNEPTYFPENSYFYVGDKAQAVTALGKQEGVLVIFKEKEMYYAEYAYTDVSDESLVDRTNVDVTSSAFFPLTQLHPAIGCDLPDTVKLCGNRLVWACRTGEVFTLTSLSNWTERSVRCLSYAIEPTLKEGLKDGHAMLYHGNYLLFCGRDVYLFDYMSNGFTYNTSYADDRKAGIQIPWFYWQVPEGYGDTTYVFGRDDAAVVILLSKEEGWLTVLPAQLSDYWETDHLGLRSDCDDIEIASSIDTKQFSFDHPHHLKMLKGLFLHLAQTGQEATVTYLVDDGREEETVYTAKSKKGKATSFAPVRIPCRQARARTVGLRLESRGRMVLAGMTWEYRTIGEVK